jgi:mRNA interferase RelE/StbE
VYSVRFLKAAIRDLEKLDRMVARAILDRLEWLSRNLHNTKLFPLKGDLRGLFKLREGSYRIIFEILHEEKVILVHAVGHRRDVYKQR